MQKLQTQNLKPEHMIILRFPTDKEFLSQKSLPVVESIPDSPTLQNFIKSMLLTMRSNRGIGLSAIQVGVPLRLFVLEVEGKTKVVINPIVLEEASLKSENGELIPATTYEHEGCLSIPYVSAQVIRPREITVNYMDETGFLVKETLSGIWCRAFCHELDHLDGLTIYDKINDISKKSFMKKVNKVNKILGT